ncbi:MAG: hypothetical protein V7L14_11515 [Nostoc sp.]|uniref:hypothetical protein n=1 Tax=Nostoc sp. TaxID=1180 RepID=UPI002FF5073D
MSKIKMMPNAQCPMPNARCPMPNAQCPMPNSKKIDLLPEFRHLWQSALSTTKTPVAP